MEPNITAGQSVQLNESAYRTPGDVKRGDVVVLRYPQDATRLFVKRVIGLPGETVSIVDGRVSINGEALSLTAAEAGVFVEDLGEKKYRVNITSRCSPESNKVVLGRDDFFVIGDNRCASLDSRNFGPVAFDSVVGTVTLDK
jgi:signal peptidase I